MNKGIIMAFAVFMVVLTSEGARVDTLYLGPNYSQPIYVIPNGTAETEGGGSIDPSTLNRNALSYVYCIDIYDEVRVQATYNAFVNTSGQARTITAAGFDRSPTRQRQRGCR